MIEKLKDTSVLKRQLRNHAIKFQIKRLHGTLAESKYNYVLILYCDQFTEISLRKGKYICSYLKRFI